MRKETETFPSELGDVDISRSQRHKERDFRQRKRRDSTSVKLNLFDMRQLELVSERWPRPGKWITHVTFSYKQLNSLMCEPNPQSLRFRIGPSMDQIRDDA